MLRDIVVAAVKRTDLGKNASRRLRRAGKVPVVLYGTGVEPASLAVDPRSLAAILYSESGENTLFGVSIEGVGTLPGKVMIREHQVDPITDAFTHADFLRVAMDKAIRVQVAVHTVGIAKGVRLQGGIVDHPLREVEVECLPGDIPERIDVDITELELGHSIRVSDLKVGKGVQILTEPGMAVASVVAPTVEKVPAPGAEGVAAVAEPEVIKKGKGETAEEGEAEAPPAKKGGEKGGEKSGKPEKK